MLHRQTSLSANITAFCRHLRTYDFTIGIQEEIDALQALEVVSPFDSPEQMQLCLQTILCRSPKQLKKFPKLYKNYWQELDKAINSKVKEEAEKKPKRNDLSQQKAPSLQALKNWLYGNKTKEETEMATYSDLEVLTKEDFASFNESELQEVYKVVKIIAQKLANQQSRRFQKSKKAAQFDLKNTLRLSLRRGGEILDIVHHKRKKQEVKIVLICDVSRSMELYSHFLIQFMYAFKRVYKRLDIFAFSTSLQYISKALEEQTLKTALHNIANTVPNWSGGTRIGSSLETFCLKYAHKTLSGKSIVLIMSDGWDTGDIDLLEAQMRYIHRKASKVLWLNPLAGHPNYEPKVRGMQTALPYIDVFLPAYNLESLQRVVRHLL